MHSANQLSRGVGAGLAEAAAQLPAAARAVAMAAQRLPGQLLCVLGSVAGASAGQPALNLCWTATITQPSLLC